MIDPATVRGIVNDDAALQRHSPARRRDPWIGGSRGKDDRRKSYTKSEYVPGGSVGPAKQE